MCHKAGLHIDLLHVVAYGPAVARVAAANLLFLYWPALNPNPAERKAAINHYQSCLRSNNHFILICDGSPTRLL